VCRSLRAIWQRDTEWRPEMDPAGVERELGQWRKAVERKLDWA
jgi:glycerol kinase